MEAPHVSSLRYKIRSDFDSLQKLIEVAERAILREAERSERELEQELSRYDPGSEEHAFVCGFYDEDLFQVRKDFPRILRYAFLASMMGIVEANTVRLTRLVRKFPGVTEEFNHTKPKVIERAICYIKKHTRVDTSRMHSNIRLAEVLSRIRNCVVHNQGVLGHCKGRDRQPIKKYLNENPSSCIDNEDRVWLDEHFVRIHLHEMRRFLMKLHEAIVESRV
jgi:hypothetical protein